MPKTPLRALFFDVDDTVYSITEFAELARRNAIRNMIRAGLRVEEEDCLHELHEVIREFGSNDVYQFDKLLKRFPPEVMDGLEPLVIIAAGIVGYHQTKVAHFKPYGDAIEVLCLLKERGLTLGLITAGVGIKQAEKIYRLGLHEIVPAHLMFITEVHGINKTNPKIYLRACQRARAAPNEAIYVGDNPTVDIDVPARIGMHTVLNRREGKYMLVEGERTPNHVINNFYDLLDILDREYEILPS